MAMAMTIVIRVIVIVVAIPILIIPILLLLIIRTILSPTILLLFHIEYRNNPEIRNAIALGLSTWHRSRRIVWFVQLATAIWTRPSAST